MIRLSSYSENYKKALLEFQLPAEQARYTALPCDALEMTLQDPDRYPMVIVKENTAVGFFVLHIGSDYTLLVNNPKAILMRAFSIDAKYQGKGYAKETLKLLPAYVSGSFPDVNEIILAVNEENIPAQHLYNKAGFVDYGNRKQGSHGLQFIYQYPSVTR